MLKKTIVALLVLAAVVIGPKLSHPAVDVGKLEPAEAVQIIAREGRIRIVTDTGAWGEGNNLTEAANALHNGTPGEVFLKAADYLILTGEFRDWEALCKMFRPACRVCLGNESIHLEEAAAYLRAHPPEQTLGQLRGGINRINILIMKEGRGSFVRK